MSYCVFCFRNNYLLLCTKTTIIIIGYLLRCSSIWDGKIYLKNNEIFMGTYILKIMRFFILSTFLANVIFFYGPLTESEKGSNG